MIQRFQKKLTVNGFRPETPKKQTDNDPITQIGKTIRVLTQKINILCMNQQKVHLGDHIRNVQRMEERFQNVLSEVPKLAQYSDTSLQQRKYDTQIWLGKLCQEVFSITFNMFQLQKLNDRKAKAFCCENMLTNIIKMIRVNNLSSSQIANIDKCLRDELIPYSMIKYPMSEEAEVNLEFENKIIEIQSMEDNENDLVFRSKIQFNYRADGNYNREIMRFLNYIIELPNTKIDISGKKETIFKLFHADMQGFFKNIEDEEFTLKMNRYQIRQIQSDTIILEDVMKSFAKTQFNIEEEKQRQKYRQTVKQFTKKFIGRKISENVKTYSQMQINQGQLKLKNPAIMRIITKWCIQLMENFDTHSNILGKQDQFRMKDGKQKLLKRKHLAMLAQLLKREKKKVDAYLKKVVQNNSESQFDFGSRPIPKQLIKLSESECQVGIFASSVISNYQTYLAGYLNVIIHAIATATKDYQEMVKAYQYKQEQYGVFIEQWQKGRLNFDELINKAYSYRLASVPAAYISLIPQLISFRVGDLIRCKCLSKQKQIIALYAELQRLSRMPKSNFKIVRIKNRLQKGTKDILINVLYRKSMLVQVQLAVASNRSKFIDFSNKYNHVLYELKRAQFGPISQMCNIWINNDIKAEFYLNQTMNYNQRKKRQINQKIQHECKGNSIQFPFRCSQCNYFYNDCKFSLKHIECNRQGCSKKVCSLCRAQKFTYKELKQHFKEIPDIEILGMKPQQKFIQYRRRSCANNNKKKRTFLQGQDYYGVLIDLKGQSRKPIYYLNSKLGKRNIIIQIVNTKTNQLKVLKEIITNQELRSFKKQYLIFSSDKIAQIIRPVDQAAMKRFSTVYNIPKYMKKWYLKQKQSIVYMSAELNDKDLEKINYKFAHTTKLCLYDNNLTNFQGIMRIFRACQILDLGYNKIQELTCKEDYLKNLRVLYLNNNKIKKIDPLFLQNLNNLQQFELANNQLDQIPQDISKVKNLKIINLSKNHFTKMSQQITKLENLEVLNAYSSPHGQYKLIQLPQFIGNMKNLVKININFNNIETFPQSIGDLSRLQILYVASNKLNKLPKSFQKLQSLKTVNFASNEFQRLPQSIGELANLEILNLQKSSRNQIQAKKLPDSYCKLKKLKMMDISKNHLVHLPESIGEMTSLQTIFVYENKIQSIPQSIGNLKSLKQLYASNNKLKNLPDSFCQLINLQKLTIKQNSDFVGFPQKIGKLKKLRSIICNGNSISSLPSTFNELQQLTQLAIKNNKISKIQPNLVQLKKLSHLQIDNQRLDMQSRRIAASLSTGKKNY